MKKNFLTIPYTEFDNEQELDSEDRELLHQAKKAAARAYAPYSKFFVGAAVLLDNGKVIQGNNQENAAYPSGLCAERVALYAAHSQFPGSAIKTLVVTASSGLFPVEEPVPPCGACRQVLAEYQTLGGNQIRILLSGNSGKVLLFESVDSLLPFMFNYVRIV